MLQVSSANVKKIFFFTHLRGLNIHPCFICGVKKKSKHIFVPHLMIQVDLWPVAYSKSCTIRLLDTFSRVTRNLLSYTKCR